MVSPRSEAAPIIRSPGLINEGGSWAFPVAQPLDLDDWITWDTGVAIGAVSDYGIGLNADGINVLQLNVPAEASFEFSINDTAQILYSAGAMAFQQATVISTTTGDLDFKPAGSLIIDTEGAANAEYAVVTNNTQDVSTSAYIAGGPTSFGMAFVAGDDGTHKFYDLVAWATATGAPSVVQSHTVAGTPQARTYTSAGGNLALAMAAGTYDINTLSFVAADPT